MACNRESDLEKLKKLHHGKECTVFWFEESGGLVHKLWDVYVLFEVSGYGGNITMAGTFTIEQLDDLLDVAYGWT